MLKLIYTILRVLNKVNACQETEITQIYQDLQ